MTTATEIETRTLQVPGATITYDIRRNEASTEPVLLLAGQPMAAAGFATLASHFPDRTVVTFDPRGSERSVKDDPASEVSPDIQADDLHALIETVGGGPVDLFGSSGGAVTGLALVAKYPEDVRTLVAHEPPLASIVPDREYALGIVDAVHQTYETRGWGAGMAHFIAVVSHRGPFTADDVTQPGPDPQMFGMPSEDHGNRNDPLLGWGLVTVPSYEPDFDGLRAASTRIVPAVGVGSGGELAHRGGEAVAAHLGLQPIEFPSDHGGFLGGEYGQMGEPDAFAAKLREVLASV